MIIILKGGEMKWWCRLNQCIYVLIWIGQLVFMNSFLTKSDKKDEIIIFDINGFRLGLFAYKNE